MIFTLGAVRLSSMKSGYFFRLLGVLVSSNHEQQLFFNSLFFPLLMIPCCISFSGTIWRPADFVAPLFLGARWLRSSHCALQPSSSQSSAPSIQVKVITRFSCHRLHLFLLTEGKSLADNVRLMVQWLFLTLPAILVLSLLETIVSSKTVSQAYMETTALQL